MLDFVKKLLLIWIYSNKLEVNVRNIIKFGKFRKKIYIFTTGRVVMLWIRLQDFWSESWLVVVSVEKLIGSSGFGFSRAYGHAAAKNEVVSDAETLLAVVHGRALGRVGL